MSIAELERNLRALQVLRTARREEGEAPVDEGAEPDLEDDGLDAFDVDVADELAPQAEPADAEERSPYPAAQAESEA
jgi:hypothetical protein